MPSVLYNTVWSTESFHNTSNNSHLEKMFEPTNYFVLFLTIALVCVGFTTAAPQTRRNSYENEYEYLSHESSEERRRYQPIGETSTPTAVESHEEDRKFEK